MSKKILITLCIVAFIASLAWVPSLWLPILAIGGVVLSTLLTYYQNEDQAGQNGDPSANRKYLRAKACILGSAVLSSVSVVVTAVKSEGDQVQASKQQQRQLVGPTAFNIDEIEIVGDPYVMSVKSKREVPADLECFTFLGATASNRSLPGSNNSYKGCEVRFGNSIQVTLVSSQGIENLSSTTLLPVVSEKDGPDAKGVRIVNGQSWIKVKDLEALTGYNPFAETKDGIRWTRPKAARITNANLLSALDLQGLAVRAIWWDKGFNPPSVMKMKLRVFGMRPVTLSLKRDSSVSNTFIGVVPNLVPQPL